MIELIAKWRTGASKYGLAALQLYLGVVGYPFLPASDHVVKTSKEVMKLLHAK